MYQEKKDVLLRMPNPKQIQKRSQLREDSQNQNWNQKMVGSYSK